MQQKEFYTFLQFIHNLEIHFFYILISLSKKGKIKSGGSHEEEQFKNICRLLGFSVIFTGEHPCACSLW
jgi:hypothetical protein